MFIIFIFISYFGFNEIYKKYKKINVLVTTTTIKEKSKKFNSHNFCDHL